jgi:urocanate hydratase
VIVRTTRGRAFTAKSRQIEAALWMPHHTLDPEVAERPGDLVVHDGAGEPARDRASFAAITNCLTTLDSDETLSLQSGRSACRTRTNGRPKCCWPTPAWSANGRTGSDPGMSVIRQIDAGYELAARIAGERGVRIPMWESE